jgi:hypothetical protein
VSEISEPLTTPESDTSAARSRADGESPGDRGQSGAALVDDEGRALLPAARAWWSPEPGSPWRKPDVLAFWTIGPLVSLDLDAMRRRAVEAYRRAHPQIESALIADAGFEDARRVLDREESSSACPANALGKLRERRDAAERERADRFAPLLEAGLRLRLGLFLDLGAGLQPQEPLDGQLRDMHRLAFEWISARTRIRGQVQMPSGIAVCENCSLVFEPSRKSHAWACPACHCSKGRRVPLSVAWNERGGYDVAGFQGGLMLRTSVCRGCGETFEPRRLDAAYCSDRCRKRSKHRSP